MKTNHSDLIVIGGGILGVFHAYHALQKGLKVTLFERHRQPQGATVRNFGQIVPSGMNLKWQAFGRESLKIYQTIQQQVDLKISQNGSIYLASDEEELQLIEELHQINVDNNYPSQLLSAADCRKKYPNLRKDYCKAGLFYPDEISADPRFIIHRLISFLQHQPNFNYRPQTLIKEIDSEGSRCKVTDHKDLVYTAEKVILCCGSEFEILYPELFDQSELEIVKLQMLRLQPQTSIKMPGNILTGLSIRRYESFRECPSYARIKAREDQTAFWKKWGVHILFKQEADGSIILGDSHEYADACNKDRIDFYIRQDINAYFISEGSKIFDLEHWHIDTQWAGFYPQCKQSDVFEKTINNKVHIITGIGGKGMTASPGYSQSNINRIYE
ncbi:MAG: TIGR03364 family FAD-dependent oxidoreductase [Sphingobacteriales bacterium]|nr:MAG: TIGR03364 family FAD-dependent oxidoreductase [Sphingobacteriales bacterium]